MLYLAVSTGALLSSGGGWTCRLATLQERCPNPRGARPTLRCLSAHTQVPPPPFTFVYILSRHLLLPEQTKRTMPVGEGGCLFTLISDFAWSAPIMGGCNNTRRICTLWLHVFCAGVGLFCCHLKDWCGSGNYTMVWHVGLLVYYWLERLEHRCRTGMRLTFLLY